MAYSYFTNYAFVDPSIPETWGAQSWTFLHAVAAGFPETPSEEDREHYQNFFQDLHYVLPCNECKRHFGEVLEKMPLTDAVLINRKTFNRWIMEVHNTVSRDLQKPKQFTWREYCKRYKGVDDNAFVPGRNAERITRKARVLSRGQVLPKPDNSLGTVGNNTPAKWNNATKGWNDVAMKSLERNARTTASVYVPGPGLQHPAKKKCGCKK
jgi:hypothetical protein